MACTVSGCFLSWSFRSKCKKLFRSEPGICLTDSFYGSKWLCYENEMTVNRLNNALSENFDLNNQTQLLVILTKVQVPPVSTATLEIHLTCQWYVDILLHCTQLTPKWRPINYTFVCMLISPLRLVNMYKKQTNFQVKVRRGRLINMQTEE